jgi:hypothetical protein
MNRITRYYEAPEEEPGRLVLASCRRCGAAVWTLSRALNPANQRIMDRFGRVCTDCLTEEEALAILEEILDRRQEEGA